MSMLGTQDLWIFISAGVALNIVPGQDFVFIANRSSNFGFRGGVLAAFGVTKQIGILNHFSLLNRFLECDQYGVQKIQKHDMPFMFKR